MATVKLIFEPFIDKLEKQFQDEAHEAITQRAAQKAGDEMVKLIRSMAKKGKTPISNRRNYNEIPYRGSYKQLIAEKKRVVGSDGRKHAKSLKPVNLTASGNFLKGLTAKGFSNGDIEIGFNKSQFKDMEEGHRSGAKGQGKRPLVPIKGEKFKREIVDLYVDIITDEIIKKFR